MELVISPTGICINLQNIVDRTFPGVVSLMLQDISLAFFAFLHELGRRNYSNKTAKMV